MKNLFADWLPWAILTALIWGVVPTFEKMGVSRVDPYAAVLWRSAGVTVGMLALAAFRPSSVSLAASFDVGSVLSLMLAGMLGSILGQVTNLSAYKFGEISRVSPVTASWPLIAFVLGLIAFGETLTLQKLLAFGLIVSGIILLRL